MEKTRLEVLAEVLGLPKEAFSTRNSLSSSEQVDENSDEFILKQGEEEAYYNVLKNDELDSRVADLINDCFSEEEIEETYGLEENGEPDLSTADINTYMELVAKTDDYYVYTTSD
jgi:hypothetical protein